MSGARELSYANGIIHFKQTVPMSEKRRCLEGQSAQRPEQKNLQKT